MIRFVYSTRMKYEWNEYEYSAVVLLCKSLAEIDDISTIKVLNQNYRVLGQVPVRNYPNWIISFHHDQNNKNSNTERSRGCSPVMLHNNVAFYIPMKKEAEKLWMKLFKYKGWILLVFNKAYATQNGVQWSLNSHMEQCMCKSSEMNMML